MDFFETLQSLGDLIYVLAFLPFFLLKTFLRVVFTPQWIQESGVKGLKENEEKTDGKKSDEARSGFNGYLSPLVFFILIGLFPLYLYVDTFAPGSFPNNYSLAAKIVFVAMVYLGFPAGFSLTIQFFRKKPINQTTLKPAFYAQCYCWGPAFLFVAICGPLYNNQFPPIAPSGIIALVFFLWFLVAETFIVKDELATSSVKAFFLTILFLLITSIYLLVTGIAILGGVTYLIQNKYI